MIFTSSIQLLGDFEPPFDGQWVQRPGEREKGDFL